MLHRIKGIEVHHTELLYLGCLVHTIGGYIYLYSYKVFLIHDNELCLQQQDNECAIHIHSAESKIHSGFGTDTGWICSDVYT